MCGLRAWRGMFEEAGLEEIQLLHVSSGGVSRTCFASSSVSDCSAMNSKQTNFFVKFSCSLNKQMIFNFLFNCCDFHFITWRSGFF